MNLNKKVWIFFASFVLLVAILACSSTTVAPATPEPTATPRPTDTPKPTDTPRPTDTPVPTATPRPTDTPEPTATLRPTDTPEPPPSAAGRWSDPDTSGTVTTIAEQNGQTVVVSIINPNRGGNELTSSSYVNGVLTWTYCPPGYNCVISELISVTSTTLTATWHWTDGGNSGTTVYTRLP
jgi:hypothetical protein